MLLLKTDAKNISRVLEHAKHALKFRPQKLKEDELILIYETGIKTNRRKPISWVMRFSHLYADTENETINIWGKKWNFILACDKVRRVEPFDIKDLQVSLKQYNKAQQNLIYIEASDERQILRHIEIDIDGIDERSDGVVERQFSPTLNDDELIAKYDAKCREAPNKRRKIVQLIGRPTGLRDALLRKQKFVCQICKQEGFIKRDGTRYAEVHHMIELNEEAPGSLQSWNCLVLCPNCHRKMHYAVLQATYLNPGWRIILEGKEYVIQ